MVLENQDDKSRIHTILFTVRWGWDNIPKSYFGSTPEVFFSKSVGFLTFLA